MKVEQIAKIAHEVNAAYCKAIDDDSQLGWEKAPEWQKRSAIRGVEFTRDNPQVSPSESHVSWYQEKKAEGWKFGHIKNEEKKEHPCFCAYEDLPKEQQAKDHIFGAIVKQLLAI